MTSTLYKLMQKKIDPILRGERPLSFKDAERIVIKLKPSEHDQWIRIYKYINQDDRPKLVENYITKLQKVLVTEYNIYTIQSFKSVWQYYKPLTDLKIQQLLIEILERSASSGNCDKLHQHINSLSQGEILPSRYARDIIVSIFKTYLQAATSYTFPSQSQNYMNISITKLNTMEIETDDDFNGTVPIISLLNRTIHTFELLMRNMNQQDREFTQLLVAYILEPDVIRTSPHLSKYVPAISLLSEQISFQEIIAIIDNITNNAPAYATDITLPELLIG